MAGHILVVDDSDKIRETLSTVLDDEGYQVTLADSGEHALRLIETFTPDVILLDVWMTGIDGIETLKRLRKIDRSLMIIIISGHGTIELAVKATQLGAYDFIEKPLNLDKLLITIERALEQRALAERYENLLHEVETKYRIVGESGPIKQVLQVIQTAAPTNARVLVSGENGTGKELVARAIHRMSDRKDKPFIEVNCAAIPEELIESEMFGHEKGAFTGATKQKKGKFELSHGGVLFLDEIGDMSLKTQAKVLRALEEQTIERVGGDRSIEVDVRVIAASNKQLPELAKEGKFREDLYFRLNVLEIHVPALRERLEDLPLLCQHFLSHFSGEYNKRAQTLSPETLSIMRSYDWPGNIRELRNVIEALVILSPGEVIGPDHLPPRIKQTSPVMPEEALGSFSSLKEARDDFERRYIVHTLKGHDYNVAAAAEELGIERTNLYRKLKSLGLDVAELKEQEDG